MISGTMSVTKAPRYFPNNICPRDTAFDIIRLSVPRARSPAIASKVNKIAKKLIRIPMKTQSILMRCIMLPPLFCKGYSNIHGGIHW